MKSLRRHVFARQRGPTGCDLLLIGGLCSTLEFTGTPAKVETMSKLCSRDLEFSLVRRQADPAPAHHRGRVHLPFRWPLLAFYTNFSCAVFALLAASKPEV
jgi:hypothetical protein